MMKGIVFFVLERMKKMMRPANIISLRMLDIMFACELKQIFLIGHYNVILENTLGINHIGAINVISVLKRNLLCQYIRKHILETNHINAVIVINVLYKQVTWYLTRILTLGINYINAAIIINVLGINLICHHIKEYMLGLDHINAVIVINILLINMTWYLTKEFTLENNHFIAVHVINVLKINLLCQNIREYMLGINHNLLCQNIRENIMEKNHISALTVLNVLKAVLIFQVTREYILGKKHNCAIIVINVRYISYIDKHNSERQYQCNQCYNVFVLIYVSLLICMSIIKIIPSGIGSHQHTKCGLNLLFSVKTIGSSMTNMYLYMVSETYVRCILLLLTREKIKLFIFIRYSLHVTPNYHIQDDG